MDQTGGTPETSLVGRLPDEAALRGVFNALYDLHLSLLSVKLIQQEND